MLFMLNILFNSQNQGLIVIICLIISDAFDEKRMHRRTQVLYGTAAQLSRLRAVEIWKWDGAYRGACVSITPKSVTSATTRPALSRPK